MTAFRRSRASLSNQKEIAYTCSINTRIKQWIIKKKNTMLQVKQRVVTLRITDLA